MRNKIRTLACAHALFFLLNVVTMIISLYKGYIDRTTGICSVLFILIVMSAILFYIFMKNCNYSEDCKSLPNSVKRLNVVILIFSATIVFFDSIPIDLNSTYPNAEEYMADNMNISNSGISVMRSSPRWLYEVLYIKSQMNYEINVINEDNSLTDVDKLLSTSEIECKYNLIIPGCVLSIILAIVCLLKVGTLSVLIPSMIKERKNKVVK